MLSRDEILSADDAKLKKVPVPEWAGKGQPKGEAFVFVKCMTGEERDDYESGLVSKSGEAVRKNIRARLVAFTACDADGNLLFTQKDIAALGKKSIVPLQRLFNASVRLNAIGRADIDELAENLEKNPSGGSVSD